MRSYPLLPLQQSFYLSQRAGRGGCYFVVEFGVASGYDSAAVARAIHELKRRHSALRLAFAETDEGPRFHVLATPPTLPFTVIDGRSWPAASVEKRVDEVARELARQKFRPALGECIRAVWIDLPEQARLLVNFDHLAIDGYSVRAWLSDLRTLLTGSLGRPAPCFVDYVRWREWQDPSARADDERYWLEKLGDAPAFPGLPRGYELDPAEEFDAHQQLLAPELVSALKALAKHEELSLYYLLFAAFAKVWGYALRVPDLVFNAPLANRKGEFPKLTSTVGCLTDIYPVLVRDVMGKPLLKLAREIAADLAEAQAHTRISGVEIARLVSARRGTPPAALSPITFTSILFMNAVPHPSGVWYRGSRSGAPETFLDMMVWRSGDGLALMYNFNRRALASAFIGKLAEQMRRLLERVARQRGDRSEFDCLFDGEDARLHARLNRGRRDVRVTGSLDEAFSRIVQRYQERVALTDGDRNWTYAELSASVDHFALALLARGVSRGERVGLYVGRRAEAVIGILAILRAGGAYVPIDSRSPSARLRAVAENAELRLIVTEQSSSECVLQNGFEALCVETIDVSGMPASMPAFPAGSADDLAYVIHTSGTTGEPKGVAVRQRQVLRLFAATEHWFGFDHDDVWTLFHSVAFDFSVWEIWGALLHGGRLVIVPNEAVRSPFDFYDLLRKERVTFLSQTPSAFSALMAEDGARSSQDRVGTLRHVVFGGEALNFGSLKAWFERHGDQRPQLANMYGITELTVHATYRRVLRRDAEGKRGSLIGVPLPDLTLHVLDAEGRPTPAGVEGELYVGGAGVVDGYLGKPALTEARFVSGLPTAEPSEVLYRSGDRVRLLPDGELEYAGRVDRQVQVRGFRIELGEIEHHLMRLPELAAARVLVHELAGDDQRIIAYLVARGPKQSAASLRQMLGQRLPAYMLPSRFVYVDALPMTSQGKLDMAALLKQCNTSPPAEVVVNSETEAALCELWAELLRLGRVSPEDDFFSLGGHSLLAVQLVTKLGRRMGRQLSVSELFEHPSPRALAAHLARSPMRCDPQLRELLPEIRPKTLPLSYFQEALWLSEQLAPGLPQYNVTTALRLRGALNVPALERSLQSVVDRHEILRTSFESTSEGPCQKPQGCAVFLCQLSCAATSPAERLNEAKRLLDQDAARAFDLTAPPTLRATLIAFQPDDYLLGLTLHHIAADFWSLEILNRELAQYYRAYSSSQEPDLKALSIQYPEFALFQRRYLSEARKRDELEYWRASLSGYSGVCELPLDAPRPSTPKRRAGSYRFAITPETWAALQRLAKSEGATLFSTLLAGFQAFVARISANHDVCVGSPVTQRPYAEFEPLIGFFVNTVALRIKLDGVLSFRQCVERVRAVTLSALSHAALPFEELVSQLRPTRHANRTPLFQLMFVLQERELELPKFSGLTCEWMQRDAIAPKVDLALGITAVSGAAAAIFEYDADLFTADTIAAWADQFQAFLGAASSDPDRPLQSLGLAPKTADNSLNRPQPEADVTSAPEHSAPRDELEQRLCQLWARALGCEQVGPRDNFFDLGGHSLLAVGLVGEIYRATGLNVGVDELFEAPCVETLARRLRRAAEPDSGPRILVTVREEDRGTPAYLVHPVGGSVFCYTELAARLGSRPVLALQSPALQQGQSAPKRLEDMAAHYRETIRRHQPSGPYCLCGWSMGGLTAFEMARQAELDGDPVAALAMIDTHLPSDLERGAALDPIYQEQLFVRDLHGLTSGRVCAVEASPKTQPGQLLAEFVAQAAGLRDWPMPLDSAALWRRFEVFRENLHAMLAYQPSAVSGPVTLIQASSSANAGSDLSICWAPFCNSAINWLPISADHFSLMRPPHVQQVAAILRREWDPAILARGPWPPELARDPHHPIEGADV